jgi:hypothetical protein
MMTNGSPRISPYIRRRDDLTSTHVIRTDECECEGTNTRECERIDRTKVYFERTGI